MIVIVVDEIDSDSDMVTIVTGDRRKLVMKGGNGGDGDEGRIQVIKVIRRVVIKVIVIVMMMK
jgi:hypothetical protein